MTQSRANIARTPRADGARAGSSQNVKQGARSVLPPPGRRYAILRVDQGILEPKRRD